MLAPSTIWSPTTSTTTWTSPTTTWTIPTTTTTLPTTTDPPTTTTTTTPVITSPPPPTTTHNPTTQPPVRTTTTLTTPFTSLISSPPTSLIPTSLTPTSTDLSVVPSSTNGTGGGTGGGIPKVAVIGIAAAGVVIIGFVSIVLVIKNQRHKRRQQELDPNELFGPNTLTNITSGHHQHKHHQHPDDGQYPENQYDDGGAHQHEMEQLYHNSDYHHQNHHGHYDDGHHGHHGGDHNGYDHGGGHDSGTNQAPGHYDPSSGQGQAQGNTYSNPSSGGHQAIGNDGATGNQYAPNGGNGGDFQGVGHGASDTGNYNYGVGQGQSVGGADQGHHLYDGYGGGHDTGYGHGSSGNDFGGYGQGNVDPSSGYSGNGVSGGGSNIGVAGTGAGGIGGSQPVTSIPSGLQGGYAPYSIGAIPPPVPFIPNRNSSNQVPVNPANTTAQQESYLLDSTSIPAPPGTSSTSYRPLDRFSSNASRSTHYSGGTGGGNSPVPLPPIPTRPGSSTITHSTWDNSTQEFRPDRPLSQTSMASSTTAGAYHQSIGSPIMYQDFIPPPTTNRVPSPKIASVLPATTAPSTTGVRRSVGAPQDRGPDLAFASGGQASDLNAFERRAPQTQENAQNPDSLFNVVASTLRQPQGGGP